MRLSLALLAALACSARSPEAAEAPEIMAGPKTPDTTVRSFVRGPSTSPAGALEAWLDQQPGDGEPPRLRLPVVLQPAQVGFSLRDARIGNGADALVVRLDDTALGIGLADHARRHCQGQTRCALWIEGHWGRVEGQPRVRVLKMHAPVSLAELEGAMHVEVEIDP